LTKVLEAKLLSKDRFDRMLEAKDYREALKLLADTTYSDLVEKLTDPERFEELLFKELERTYRKLRSFSEEQQQAIDLFVLEYDFHNLKVLLKAKLGDISFELSKSALIPLGTLGKEFFLQLLKLELPEIFKSLPSEYVESCRRALTSYEDLKDPRVIDAVVDKSMFDRMWLLALQSNCQILKEIVQIYIDLSNIKTLLRGISLEREKALLNISLVPNGKIDYLKLLELSNKDYDSILSELAKGYYKDIITKSLEYYHKEGSWLLLEKLFEDLILKTLKETKHKIGLEPIIGYLLAKKMETKIIRLILVAKLNNLPVEGIKKLWREFYV
jgi:V/A-type H+-transporting ATPase subunit C